MKLISSLLSLTITLQIESISTQDLKSIFQIPNRRSYDELEILERSNFDNDDSSASSPPPLTPPTSFANAQVMLRFGEEATRERFGDLLKRERCACGDACNCRNPYYVPIFTPPPYCWCVPPNQHYAPPNQYYAPPTQYYPSLNQFYPPPPQYYAPPTQYCAPQYPHYAPPHLPLLPPPLPPPCHDFHTLPYPPFPLRCEEREKIKNVNVDKNEVNIVQNENIVNELNDGKQVVDNVFEERVEIEKNNHPEILKTITFSDDSIRSERREIGEDVTEVKYLEKVSEKIEPTECSTDIKLLDLGLSKVSKFPKKEFNECLIPYRSPVQKERKLLVSYPIFNRDYVEESPIKYKQSGYAFSEGSSYYTDPVKTIVYKKPNLLSVYDKRIVVDEIPKVVRVPVILPTPAPHTEDCCCSSCAKYAGELNEQ